MKVPRVLLFFACFTWWSAQFVSLGNNVELPTLSEAPLDAFSKCRSQTASTGLLDVNMKFHKGTIGLTVSQKTKKKLNDR